MSPNKLRYVPAVLDGEELGLMLLAAQFQLKTGKKTMTARDIIYLMKCLGWRRIVPPCSLEEVPP